MLEDFYNLRTGFAWWICPEDFQVQRFAGDFGPRAKRLGWGYREHPHVRVRNHHGAILHGITAKNLNKIAAYHPKLLYADEAAKLPTPAWNLIEVRMVHVEKVVLMSTPRPNHWRRLVQDGRKHLDGEWTATEISTPDAGLVAADRIRKIQKRIPDDLFRQEFLAMFVKGAGAVFRRVARAAHWEPEEYQEGETYLITQDVAKHEDYGWITVWKGMRVVKCVWLEHVSYKAQARRAVEISLEYGKAQIVFDQTGVGESYGEILEERAAKHTIAIDGLVFTGQNKPMLVNAAVKAFEEDQFELIDPKHGEPYDIFVEEVQAYQQRRTGNGLNYSYSAPEGEHDDSVSTLLLRMSVDRLTDGVAGYYEFLAKRNDRRISGGETTEGGGDEEDEKD